MADISQLPEVKALERVRLPCWLVRIVPGSLLLSALWCNSAASQKFGRLFTEEERARIVAGYPPKGQASCRFVVDRLVKTILVLGESCCHRVQPQLALRQIFSEIKADATIGDVTDQPFPIEIDGRQETLMLSQWEDTGHAIQPDILRANAIQIATPIHSYLFDAKGKLLYANSQARCAMKGRGLEDTAAFQLEDVLLEDGMRQPKAAETALRSLIVEKQTAHRITLRNAEHNGQISWTLYEMWPSLDPVAVEPAMLVSSFDVTSQKALEEQLEDAQKRLLIQNSSLQRSCIQLTKDQQKMTLEKEGLMKEQQALQAQLTKALQLHVKPKTSVDTATIADKIVNIFDEMIQGKQVGLEDIIELRNAANNATDFRQPVNLQHQLMNRSGLSQDVGACIAEMLQEDSNSSAKRWARRRPDMGAMRRLMTRKLTKEASTASQPEEANDAARDAGSAGNSGVADSNTEPAAVSEVHAAAAVDRPLTPDVERLLQAAADTSNFSFDMFQLAEASGNRPLSVLACFLMKETGLFQIFRMSEKNLHAVTRRIEDGYPDNPYHNRIHAASVLQMMHLLIQNGLAQQGILDGVTMLACYISAIVHDYDHQGVNNDFLIKTRNDLAITHNDASPNEAHHVAALYHLLKSDPAYNYAPDMPMEERNIMRASVIELVLATDMKRHFGLISQFQMLPKLTVEKINEVPMMSESPEELAPALSAQQKLLILQIALKCADLGHLAAPQAVHTRWVDCLAEEFYRQGDKERANGMKISPLMDRDQVAGISKSQVGFFEIVAMPLYKSYVELIPAAQPMLDNLKTNYRYWHGLHQASAA